MKKLLHLLPLLAVLVSPAPAATAAPLDAVRRADDTRVAATIAADQAGLGAIFSDGLRYAHSSGAVDTKASYMEALVSGRTKYFAIDYEERKFSLAAPGIVLMSGRARFRTANNGQPSALYLGFLAVWREEAGGWRFLAWQSCRLPEPAPAAPAK